MQGNLVLIPLLPLLAALLVGFFGKRYLKQYSHWPTIIAFPFSCSLSVAVYAEVRNMGGAVYYKPVITELYQWVTLGPSDPRLAPPGGTDVTIKDPAAA